ncbi:MAG: cytochrome c1 [Gammaproteobacteria bacterium]|nr:cytochrome c1 [Gammaproteobacteria bacterium]
MKKPIFALLLALLPVTLMAAGGGVKLTPADVDLGDQASLQRGAKTFVNYCLSCHSASYMRYNRMAKDLGLTEAEVIDNLMFTTDKIGNTMTIAMTTAQAKQWFGNPPPDLSVTARSRGADWLYSYFTGFYVDEKRPFGVNNAIFADVGMPNVLWELEGAKRAKHDEHGKIIGYEMVTPGLQSETEFKQTARDLTAFMVYMGEPVQMERKRLGVWVILFLSIFFVLAYFMKREYWKDIH